MNATFLLSYAAGLGWRKLASMQEAPIPDHFAWVQAQRRAGALLLAGPTTDVPGALATVRAENEGAVRELAGTDPAIMARYFQIAEVRPFRILVGLEGRTL